MNQKKDVTEDLHFVRQKDSEQNNLPVSHNTHTIQYVQAKSGLKLTGVTSRHCWHPYLTAFTVPVINGSLWEPICFSLLLLFH